MVLILIYRLMSGRFAITPTTTVAKINTPKTFETRMPVQCFTLSILQCRQMFFAVLIDVSSDADVRACIGRILSSRLAPMSHSRLAPTLADAAC